MNSAIDLRRFGRAVGLVLLIALGSPAAAADVADADIPVREFRLRMDPTDARALFLKEPEDRSLFDATVLDGGREIAARIAVKGSSSRLFQKKSLLLSLAPGDGIDGRRRFALNAMATDPTQSREWMTWDLVERLGLLAPQARYARVFINDTLIGTYLDIEWMDASMFKRHGHPGAAEFMQPDDVTFCGDLFPAPTDGLAACWTKVTPRDNDFTSLAALVAGIDAAPVADFDRFLDTAFVADSVIDWLVVNTIVQSTDTYNKNYWLYRDAGEGKWRVIPWDYDLTWGRTADGAADYPLSVFNDRHQYTFPPDAGADNALKQKVLRNPALYARFLARLRTVLGEPGGDRAHPAFGWFTPAAVAARQARIARVIEPGYEHEAYGHHSRAELDLYRDAMAFFATARHHLLTKLLLQPSPFDTPRWLPYMTLPVLTPVTPETLRLRQKNSLPVTALATLTERDRPVVVSDELLVWLQAIVTLRDGPLPLRLSVDSEREIPPVEAPPGLTLAQCVERTWTVTVKDRAAATLDLTFDYLDESSTRTEVGAGVRDEAALVLWHFDGTQWRALKSRGNRIANTLHVDGLRLQPHIAHRFLACPAA